MKTSISYCLRLTLFLFLIFAIKTNAQLFLPKVDYATFRGPILVAIGDFNVDNNFDLVVSKGLVNKIGILLGNGNGTFQNEVDYATGSSPLSVAIGDFNGDNKSDLAVANYNDNTVSILLGIGNGTFQNKVDYATGSSPLSVAIGDFNGDNKSDIAVTDQGNARVSILLGNGNGTFQNKVDYIEGPMPSWVAIGDFNGDNKSDLAVTDEMRSTVGIFLGNGDGTFPANVNYTVGSCPQLVAIGDFNGDNKADLAVANKISDNVSILIGNGNGTFQNKVDYATGSFPRTVAIGDYNRDNILDLAVVNQGSNNVGILLGNVNGTFQNKIDYGTGAGPFSVAVGDFNGDNKSDIAVTNNTDNDISILINQFNRLPTAANGSSTINEDNIKTFAAGDFNYTDTDNDLLSKIQITSLPETALLFKDANLNSAVDVGEIILLNGEVTKTEIDANKLKFEPALNQNGSPYNTFNFKVHDGTAYSGSSYTMTINVNAVNDVPVFTKGGNQSINEDSGAHTIAGWATGIGDGDPELTQSLTFNVSNDNNTLFSVLPSINSSNGNLTFTTAANANGSATVTVTLSDDGSGVAPNVNTSAEQTFTITVSAINDAPVLAAIEAAALSYTEGDAATAVTSTITVSDVDDINIESATVQITTNYSNGEDILSFTNQNGIIGTWTAATGTMALSGSATKANYQTALRDVKYNNTSDNPSTLARTVSFTVNDGDINSNTTTRQINIAAVNDVPVLAAIEAAALSYTEGDAATAVTSTITVNDVDDTNIESATIQITTNYSNGEDILSFTNQNGITGSWTVATGTMALSGSATKANYQTALRSVKYNNVIINPSTLARTVNFTINDGDNNSNSLTRQINITANTYTMNVTSINGTVAKDPDQTDYNYGTAVTLTASPSTGYTFTGWSGDATGTANPLIITMDGNKNITANYAINTYTLTIISVNGTVAKNPNQASYNHGTTVQLTATPNVGYTFTGWSGDATGTTNPLTVRMDGNKNITANYAINTYTLTITSVNGTVTKNPDQTNYNYGTAVTLTASPSTGYTFTGWSGDATGSTNPLTVAMDGNKNITANYSINTYTLTIISTNGTVVKNPDQSIYNYGTTVQLSATPNVGYTFTGWSGDATGSTNPLTITMDVNKSITANFSINTYTLTVTSVNGTVTKNPNQTNYNYGTTVQLTATAHTGYTFTGWSGDASGLTNPLTILMDGNKNITANYTINTYTLTITSVNGTVVKNPNQATYNHGTTVLLTATQNMGYTFTGWSGDESGTTNPLTIIMNGNKNITANFTIKRFIISGSVTQGINPLPNVTVTFSHDGHQEQTFANGTYSHNVDFGTITTVTPTKSGYTFSPICMNYYNVISDQVGNYSATPLINSPVATEPTSVTRTSFNANWELSKEAIGYRLDVATDINFTNYVSGYRDLDVGYVQTKTVRGLNSQTAYYYRVRAYSTDGAISNSSNTVGVITLLPQAPSGISISFNSNGNVVLQWVYNEEVKWFYIYREGGVNGSVKTNFVMTFTLIDSVAGNVKAYTDTKAVEGADYIYSIVAVSSNGATSGIGTEGATGTPITAPLKSPTNLTAILQSDGKVLLSWECNSSIEDGCAIERSQNTNTSFSECGKANVGIHTFIDDKVIKGIKYYYRTAAFKGTLKSAYSNEVSVTAIISDIKEINDGIPNIFSLSQNYPNPFNPITKIKFGLPENAHTKLIIYDILGREVSTLVNREFDAGIHEVNFDGSKLSSGVYFYRISASKFTSAKKFLLMK